MSIHVLIMKFRFSFLHDKAAFFLRKQHFYIKKLLFFNENHTFFNCKGAASRLHLYNCKNAAFVL